MKLFGTTVFLVGALAILAAPVHADASAQQVRLYYSSEQQVLNLVNTGVDIVAHGDDYVDVVKQPYQLVSPRLDRLQTMAMDAFEFSEVLEADLNATLKRFEDRPDLGVYHTLAEVEAEMSATASEHSTICRIEVLSETFEGRPIRALVIGPKGPKAADLPRFLMTGCHHAWEWISVEVPMALIQHLTDGYETDPSIKALVDSRLVWVVPVLNPDGLHYGQTERKMWRKNRGKNQGRSYGVDPDRNYGYEWGGAGASIWPSSDTYRGTAGFSEAETAAIRDLTQREHFSADISLHSYSQLILWPWSYSRVHIPSAREDVFKQFGDAMAELNGYDSKESSDLYPSSGDFDDFLHGGTGSLSFTFEWLPSSSPTKDESRPSARRT